MQIVVCKYMPACKTKRIKICTLSTAKLFTAEVYAKICILCLLKNPYILVFMFILNEKSVCWVYVFLKCLKIPWQSWKHSVVSKSNTTYITLPVVPKIREINTDQACYYFLLQVNDLNPGMKLRKKGIYLGLLGSIWKHSEPSELLCFKIGH